MSNRVTPTQPTRQSTPTLPASVSLLTRPGLHGQRSTLLASTSPSSVVIDSKKSDSRWLRDTLGDVSSILISMAASPVVCFRSLLSTWKDDHQWINFQVVVAHAEALESLAVTNWPNEMVAGGMAFDDSWLPAIIDANPLPNIRFSLYYHDGLYDDSEDGKNYDFY